MKNLRLFAFTMYALLLAVAGSAQIPTYNSYPSAQATIYLDFDGQLVNGTSWNMNGPISCGPANLPVEKITEIFNRVSEDYRPFNINITTDSTKFWAAPPMQRMRIILTISSSWYGSAGGVSYVGSFSWGDNTPAFVFTALLNYNAKNIAEATAHEAGHTLGLRHQSAYDGSCAKTAEYNAGAGSGEIGWAPIMGVGYYRNFTLWNNGANPYGCTSYQDDLGIITSTTNGFGYRADDHANNMGASASALNLQNNQFEASGVIEKTNDQDVFRFTIRVPGRFHLDAIPYNIGTGDAGSNLDMQVEILNSAQTVIGSYNPELVLNSSIDTMLNAGDYYLRVEGKGNIYAPEYASLGSYTLKGGFVPSPVLPLHKLGLQGASENGKHSFNWVVEADEKVVAQTLEVASNPTSFQQAASISSTARSYHYVVTSNSNILYYRLNVVFDNGQQYYSNIIALRNTTGTKPVVMGNTIQGVLRVNSQAGFIYSILDLNGRLLSTGKIAQGMNVINTASLSRGMYLIKYNNGQEIFTEKFVKQ